MSYKFDIEKGSFTFKNPETGKDWSNHFFNDLSYVMSVSHRGVPTSRYVNKESVQVTLNADHNYLYIRDAETKTYWNISGFPSLNEISNYQCEHGQQYTTISSQSQRIASSITYAIAENETREVWEVTV